MGLRDRSRKGEGSAGGQPAGPARKQSHDDIIQHMARHYGPVQELALMEIVPSSGIAVNVIPARPGHNPLILFTTGMSDRPQTVPADRDAYRYTELFIRLPAGWPLQGDAFRKSENGWPVEWLKQIACYPHDNDTWLGGPFTIIANDEPPEPLARNTRLSCLMLLHEGGEVGVVRCRDGRGVALYSMVPLYTEERDLERSAGVAALFERLQAHDVSFVVDPNRVNAVTGK